MSYKQKIKVMMKKNLLFILPILLLSALFVSCSNDDDDENSNNPNNEAKFDNSIIGFYNDYTATIGGLGRSQSAYWEFTDKKTFHMWTVTYFAHSSDTTYIHGDYFADGSTVTLNYSNGDKIEAYYEFYYNYTLKKEVLNLSGSTLIPKVKNDNFKYE